MLTEAFNRFIEKSPLTVMTRALVERLLNPQRLDAWFGHVAESQYTRELLFSTVVGMMLEVVCGVRKSVNAAYRALVEEIPVSVQAVYDKLKGLEPGTTAELVRYSAREAQAIIEAIAEQREALLPGYRVKILDGNCLAATEHRIKALRGLSGGALPGKSLVVYDPPLDLATDRVPCEDGHTQERALLEHVLARVQAGESWVMDRHFCVLNFLWQISQKAAYFVVREHQQLPWRPLGSMQEVGRLETGQVGEQPIEVLGPDGEKQLWRRIRVLLDTPTRDGDERIYLLTNLPLEIDARTLAKLYRNRWQIETAFFHLAEDLNCEINTLGYPRAALFGFGIGLVAYNTLAVLKAALRVEHGSAVVDDELSGYYMTDEISATYRGMMIAIPDEAWLIFRTLDVPTFSAWLLAMASKVRLEPLRKHRRGPKKPRTPRLYDPKRPHFATAKVLARKNE